MRCTGFKADESYLIGRPGEPIRDLDIDEIIALIRRSCASSDRLGEGASHQK